MNTPTTPKRTNRRAGVRIATAPEHVRLEEELCELQAILDRARTQALEVTQRVSAYRFVEATR